MILKKLSYFQDVGINLDYSRVEVAVAARQWPVELYLSTADRLQREADGIRSARPQDKFGRLFLNMEHGKCVDPNASRLVKHKAEKKKYISEAAKFMNNSD